MKKLKIRRFPKVRKNLRKKYKFSFNAKLKNNCLTKKTNYITSFTQFGNYYARLNETCQLRYYQLRKLHNIFLPVVKRYNIQIRFYANFFIPLTAKPLLRMGTGKGKFKYFVSKYRKGDIFLEFNLSNFKTFNQKQRFIKLLRCVLPTHVTIMRHYT